MTPAAHALLAQLAAAHGVPVPEPIATIATDLTGPAGLFALDEPWLHPVAATGGALASALAAFAGVAGATTTFTRDLAGLRAAITRHASARRPGRTRSLVVGELAWGSAGATTALATGEFTAAAAALPGIADECAMLVVEPWLPTPEAASTLRTLLANARAHGIVTVCDETRTAARAAPTTVHAAERLGADFVVLGPALAGGLPFAAAIGGTAIADAEPEPVAGAIAAAFLDAGAGHAIADGLARFVATLRDAVTRAAGREQLQLDWRGPLTMPQLAFADQDGAPGPLIEHHFGLELAALGWRVHGPMLPGADLRRGTTAPSPAFDAALARIRVKLIEYNSYLSGGVPYAWADGHATLRARGLSLYRFPRLAAVRVAPVPGGPGMRIDFAPGQLGAVTSSGFFVPTMYDGDVDVVARYVLQRWHAGPDSACLGLFLQNAASSARYYAQVMSTADRPLERSVAASLAGHVHRRVAAPGDSGWLRLQRAADTLTTWWRPDAATPWTELGRCQATGDPIFVGAKIWSKKTTDGLVADIVELAIEGTPATDQEPLLGPVPDPCG